LQNESKQALIVLSPSKTIHSPGWFLCCRIM
jgi:hypothetical protein